MKGLLQRVSGARVEVAATVAGFKLDEGATHAPAGRALLR